MVVMLKTKQLILKDLSHYHFIWVHNLSFTIKLHCRSTVGTIGENEGRLKVLSMLDTTWRSKEVYVYWMMGG